MSDLKTAMAATRLAVELFDCPACVAKAGEPCHLQRPGPLNMAHIARFPADLEPEEFLAQHGRTP